MANVLYDVYTPVLVLYASAYIIQQQIHHDRHQHSSSVSASNSRLKRDKRHINMLNNLIVCYLLAAFQWLPRYVTPERGYGDSNWLLSRRLGSVSIQVAIFDPDLPATRRHRLARRRRFSDVECAHSVNSYTCQRVIVATECGY